MCIDDYVRYGCGHRRIEFENCPLADDNPFYIRVACPLYRYRNTDNPGKCGLFRDTYCAHSGIAQVLNEAYSYPQYSVYADHVATNAQGKEVLRTLKAILQKYATDNYLNPFDVSDFKYHKHQLDQVFQHGHAASAEKMRYLQIIRYVDKALHDGTLERDIQIPDHLLEPGRTTWQMQLDILKNQQNAWARVIPPSIAHEPRFAALLGTDDQARRENVKDWVQRTAPVAQTPIILPLHATPTIQPLTSLTDDADIVFTNDSTFPEFTPTTPTPVTNQAHPFSGAQPSQPPAQQSQHVQTTVANMVEQPLTELSEADRLKALVAANKQKRQDKVAGELIEQGWRFNEITWYSPEQEKLQLHGDGEAPPSRKKGVRTGKGPKVVKGTRGAGRGTQGNKIGRPRKNAPEAELDEEAVETAKPRRSGRAAKPITYTESPASGSGAAGDDSPEKSENLWDGQDLYESEDEITPSKGRRGTNKAGQRRKQSHGGPALPAAPLLIDRIKTLGGRITKAYRADTATSAPAQRFTPNMHSTPPKLAAPFEEQPPRSLPRKEKYNKHQPVGANMSKDYRDPLITSENVSAAAPGWAGPHHQMSQSMPPPPVPSFRRGQYDQNTRTYMPAVDTQAQMPPPPAHVQAHMALQHHMAQSAPSPWPQPRPFSMMLPPNYNPIPQPNYAPAGAYGGASYMRNQTGYPAMPAQGSYGNFNGVPAQPSAEINWGAPTYGEEPNSTMAEAAAEAYMNPPAPSQAMRRDSSIPFGDPNAPKTTQKGLEYPAQSLPAGAWVPPSQRHAAQQFHEQRQTAYGGFEQQHEVNGLPNTAQIGPQYAPAAMPGSELLTGQPAAFHQPPPAPPGYNHYDPRTMFPNDLAHGLPPSSRSNTIAPAATMMPTSTPDFQDYGGSFQHGLPTSSVDMTPQPTGQNLPGYGESAAAAAQKTDTNGMVDPRLTMDGAYDGVDVRMEEGAGGDVDWDSMMKGGVFCGDAKEW